MKIGKVTAKANATDPEARTYSVRDRGDRIEYYHPQQGDWYEIPKSWVKEIVWAESE